MMMGGRQVKIAVTIHTGDYRGDHEADIQVAVDMPITATLEDVGKMLHAWKPYSGEVGMCHAEIRVMVEPKTLGRA